MDTLSLDAQQDFGAGAFQGIARHLIPRNGLYEALNALFDDVGSVYKRGGSALWSTADLTTGTPLSMFDGFLSAGQRTVVGGPLAFGGLDDNLAPLNFGNAGVNGPKRGVVIGGALVTPPGKVYAGSRKTADYVTGTITTTNGSAVITGAGTTWNTLVDVGMLLKIGSERYYIVKSVDSTTQITLTEAYEGATGAGKAYTLTPMGTLPAAQQADFYAVAGDRLVIGKGNQITFSNTRSPGASGQPPAGQLRWQTFSSSDLWQLPDGAQLLGLATIRSLIVIFTTAGIYLLHNIAYDLTDALGNMQQSLERISPDLILWGNAGIASRGDALVVPAADGVYLFNGGADPVLLSRSIAGRLRDHIAANNQPGVATVYRGHYVLPVLSAANVPVDFLMCRLDRPVRTPIGEVFPWSWGSGAGAQSPALATRRGPGDRQRLLGAAALNGDLVVRNLAVTYKWSKFGAQTAFTLGTVRYWRVAAIVAGVEQAASVEVSATVTPQGGGRFTLTWDPVPGATSYRVYRGTAAGAENNFLVPAAGTTSFLDDGTAGAAGAPIGTVGSRVLDLSGFFEPLAANKTDHDGTVPEWAITTRDVVPDRLNIEAFVRSLRVRYQLVDASTDDPVLSAWYSIGDADTSQMHWGQNWGSNWAGAENALEVQLAGVAPEDDGRHPWTWLVRKRARFIRFRLRSQSPTALLKVHNLEVKSRPSGRE